MAYTVKIYEKGDYSNGIDLIYDAGSQATYHALAGMQLGLPQTETVMHLPDRGPAWPVDSFDVNRQIVVSLNIDGGSADAVEDASARLRRWVDGADQQALRYHTKKDVNEIRIRIQRDGSTNYTDNSILIGLYDDGGALYNAVATVNDMAIEAAIVLTVLPYGEGETISLHNDLTNPAFTIGASGVAAGWTKTGTGTATLNTDAWLIGGQSQKIAAGAGVCGIVSDTISVANGVDVVAYVWIYVESGTVRVKLRNTSDGADVDTADVAASPSGSVYDKTAVDAAGNTWYRIPLSGTNSTGSAKNWRVEVASLFAAMNFYVDAAYLDATTDTTTIPAAWMSASDLENRGDQDASNPGRICHYDVWGIPGDAHALVRHKITGLDGKYFIFGAVFDGHDRADQQEHYYDSSEFTTDAASNGTWSTGTGQSGNHQYRLTANAGQTATGSMSIRLDGSEIRRLLATPRHVFARVRSDSTDARISFRTAFPAGLEQSQEIGVQNTATYELADIGSLSAPDLYPRDEDSPDTSLPYLFLYIDLEVSDGAYIDFDLLWLPWSGINESFAIAEAPLALSSDTLWLDGLRQKAISTQTNGILSAVSGNIWTARPGQLVNRFTMMGLGNDYSHDLTDAHTISLDITPRTRHLLGTL